MTITPARLQNLLIYCGVALLDMLAIAVSAALAAGTMPGFREGEFFHPTQNALTGLLIIMTPILSTWLAAHQPSWGGEGLAAQASVISAQQGIHRDEMVVLSPDQAVAAVAGAPAAPDEIADLVVARIEARLRATPAPDADPGLISRPPAFLPPAPMDRPANTTGSF
jgi:hypothetical protein